MIDLVVLCADKNIEAGVTAILQRSHSLGCQVMAFKSFIHPHRDPGCYGRSSEFLQGFLNHYKRALVVFDLEGSGSRNDRSATEAEVEERLIEAGWSDDRGASVVIDPEIENWVWSDSPQVPQILGWDAAQDLRRWLENKEFWPTAAHKPPRPKEALECVLRELNRPRSSAIYAALGSAVSLGRCVDPAFIKLRATISRWFPADS